MAASFATSTGKPGQAASLRGYPGAVPKRRLDSLLAERGLFSSRSRAAAAVLAGEVRIGAHGERAAKPGQLVGDDVALGLDERPRYVSRGGIKLANALDELGVDPAGRRCLDVGASTGGFTDCLLQRGAEAVVALDVAYGELDWRLRQDARVTVAERVNARALDPSLLPYQPGLVVADVSFISLAKVLPAVLACAAPGVTTAWRWSSRSSRSGAGRWARAGSSATRTPGGARWWRVAQAARELGASVMGFASSGLPGPAGNRESFVWLGQGGRAGAVEDLEAAARRAEP